MMGQDLLLVFCVPPEIPTVKYCGEQKRFGFSWIAMCCAMLAEVLHLWTAVDKITNP